MRSISALLLLLATLVGTPVLLSACSSQEIEVTAHDIVGNWQLTSVTPDSLADPCDMEGSFYFRNTGEIEVRTTCTKGLSPMQWQLDGEQLTVTYQGGTQVWQVRELTANRLLIERNIDGTVQRMVFKRIV